MKRLRSSLVPTLVTVLAVGWLVNSWWNMPCIVHGRVTVAGQPVPAGSVLMVSDAPKWATIGVIGPAGEYEIADVPRGPVRIGVRTRRVQRSDGVGELVWSPPRFEDPGSSGLGLTVRRGRQRHDLDLPAE